MNNEPLIAPAQTEIRLVEAPADHAAQVEQPTQQQQQAVDDVFSRDQEQAVAALLAAQMAIGLLHNCALDAFAPQTQPLQPLPRKRPGEDDEKR
jgi:hypothetical protein